MFANGVSSATLMSAGVSGQAYPRLIEVHPAFKAENDLCSYCGKVKYVAYRVVAGEDGEAIACFPCSDRGMNWLEQNFPSRPQ